MSGAGATDTRRQRPLGVFGGTFDPVHLGHLSVAWEAAELLDAEVRLIPTNVPPHRPPPMASADERVAMLRVALRGQDRLTLDTRELERSGPSYTVDTLAELRAELGQRALVLLVGADMFAQLPAWDRWHELFDLAHVGVLSRPGVGAQPVDALLDDAVGLAHFLHAHEIAVVAVPGLADGDVEVHLVVDLVGLLLAQVPGDARAAQHRPGQAQVERALGRDDADADRALLPDAVVGEQHLVVVDIAGEALGEIVDEVQQAALAVAVQVLDGLGALDLAGLVLGHRVGQVAVDAARTEVGRVHARARGRLVHVEEVLALAEGPQQHGGRAAVVAV